MSRQIETLAYLGPNGTFTHEAAINIKARDPRYHNTFLCQAPSIAEVCQMIVDGRATFGVVPIENSTDGLVNDTLLVLRQIPLYVRGEYIHPIRQSLHYPKGTDLSDIKLVISKDSALGQCRRWLKENLPNASLEERPSTVAAILEAANNSTVAAIGPRMAAETQELSEVLARIDNIHDNPLNATRFFVIDSKDGENPVTGQDKTSIIAQIPDQPGSLYSVLDTFVEQDVNLAKIKSFGRNGSYVGFLISLQGHIEETSLTNSVNRLLLQGVGIKRLGSYPQSTYQPPEIPWEFDMGYAVEQFRGEIANGGSHKDKTVVVFELRDRIGALRNALEPFNRKGINLTEIDSLPAGKMGEYMFYLTFENGENQKAQVLEELTRQCTQVAIL